MTMQASRTEAPARPSYLGLLNAISAAEGHGYGYLTKWADMTTDPEVEATVRFVAAREGEHSMSFARRIVELGFRPRPRPMSAKDQAYSDVATSDRSDLEKLRLLDYAGQRDHGAPDIHDDYFHDHTIDPETGALLGRFVAEERDSVRVSSAATRSSSAAEGRRRRPRRTWADVCGLKGHQDPSPHRSRRGAAWTGPEWGSAVAPIEPQPRGRRAPTNGDPHRRGTKRRWTRVSRVHRLSRIKGGSAPAAP